MRGAPGAQEYKTIDQRTDFYNWFDQIRKIQGQEIMWPAAAWVVASQMGNLEYPGQRLALAARRFFMFRNVDGDDVLSFAREGNKAIFDDVFPRVSDVFQRGLAGKPFIGEEALAWDKQTLRREQFEIVQTLYEKYAKGNADMAAELKDIASGSDIFTIAGITTAGMLEFKGFILSPTDRYNHGLNVVVPFYRQFETTVDTSRQRRQQSKPDPTGGGMIKVSTVEADQERKQADEAKKAADAKKADEVRKAEEAKKAAETKQAVDAGLKALEIIEQQRRALEQIEAARKAVEQAEAARQALEQANAARQAIEQAEAARHAAEQVEAARRAAELAEAARRAAEAAKRPLPIPGRP